MATRAKASFLQRHQSDLLRAAMLVLLAGPLVLVLWHFGRSGPVRPNPGSLWAQYESQIRRTVRGVGGSIGEGSCELFGNVNAGLVCPVVGVAPTVLVNAFTVDGWKPTPGGRAELSDERARLSVEAASDSSWVKVSVVLRKL